MTNTATPHAPPTTPYARFVVSIRNAALMADRSMGRMVAEYDWDHSRPNYPIARSLESLAARLTLTFPLPMSELPAKTHFEGDNGWSGLLCCLPGEPIDDPHDPLMEALDKDSLMAEIMWVYIHRQGDLKTLHGRYHLTESFNLSDWRLSPERHGGIAVSVTIALLATL